MKHAVLMATFMFSVFGACSQKLGADKVPAVVKTSFEKAHPGAKGTWELEGANYEVNFKKDGKEASCVIDSKGNILETETAIAADDLPAMAKEYIKQKYAAAKVKETTKIVKSTGETIYEAEINEQDLLFDVNGTFLKISEEKGEDKD